MAAGSKGDNVAIPISTVDIGRGDPRNIFGVITEVSDNEQYTVGYSGVNILETNSTCIRKSFFR